MWSLCTSLVPRVLQHLCVETSLVLPTQTVWFPETYSIHACIVPPTCLSPTRYTNVILVFICWFMETHNFLVYVSITVRFQRVTNVILVNLFGSMRPTTPLCTSPVHNNNSKQIIIIIVIFAPLHTARCNVAYRSLQCCITARCNVAYRSLQCCIPLVAMLHTALCTSAYLSFQYCILLAALFHIAHCTAAYCSLQCCIPLVAKMHAARCNAAYCSLQCCLLLVALLFTSRCTVAYRSLHCCIPLIAILHYRSLQCCIPLVAMLHTENT